MNKSVKNIRTVGVIGLLIVLALVYYNYLNNKAGDRFDKAQPTETEKLENYNFEDEYPKTVRDVVKLHCRYLKCIYNGDFKEEELETLNNKMRELYDDTLLAYNKENVQLETLKNDIQDYKDKKTTITSYIMSQADDVEYYTIEDIEYAKIDVTVNIKVKTSGDKTYEEYLLAKDNKDRWRIMGWRVVEAKDE